MEWNEIVNAIRDFFAQPIPVIITSIITILAAILKIISSTSIGKKALNELKNKFADLGNKYNDSMVEFNNYKEQALLSIKTAQEETLKIQQLTQEKLVAVYSQYELLESGLLGILKEIPNVKVQNAIVEFEEKYNAEKHNIEEYITNTYNDFDNAVETTKNDIENQYLPQIEQLKMQVEALASMVNDKLKDMLEEATDEQEQEQTSEVISNGTEEEI